MNGSTTLIIKSLAESSLQADCIVRRMQSYSAVKDYSVSTIESLQQDLASLQQENSRLQALITTLTSTIDDTDIEITDEQVQEFAKSLGKTLDKMDLSKLSFGYSHSNMFQYPQPIRYLVALALVNSCTLRSIQPDLLWLEIVAKNGAM